MAPKNKKNPNAQYAFAGLIIALVACIASGLLGAAKGLVAAQMFTLETAVSDNLTLWLQISLAFILLGLALYAILAPDSVRRFLSGRQARYGSNSLVLSLAFLGILIAANYLVYNNPGKPWDLTEDKSNTLADETLQALATLPENVNATAFYSSNLDSSSAEELLQKFKVNSDGKFDYKFIDPNRDPIAARAAGITGDGKILLAMGDQKEIASSASETELTRTLIRLINPSERVVYFLQGHGEAALESSGGDQTAYGIAKQTLESKNYTVNSLNLLSTNSIPEDALAIIIVGPQKPVSSNEVRLLKKYVDAGGSLVVLEDPTILTEFGDSEDSLASYLQDDWGITLNNDVIIDLTSQQPLNAISTYGGEHAITENLSENYVVIMPQARSVSAAVAAPNGVTLTPLISTSENSWGETQLAPEEGQQSQYDEGVDLGGPLTLAIAGENPLSTGRVVVMGNSLFASDDFFDAYGNGNFFINSVDWAAEQENLINITPRQSTPRTFMAPSQLSFLIIVILSVLVIPGVIVFMGVSSWIARRKRG